MFLHLGFMLLYGKVHFKTFQSILEKELKGHYLTNGNVLRKKNPNQHNKFNFNFKFSNLKFVSCKTQLPGTVINHCQMAAFADSAEQWHLMLAQDLGW